MRCRFSPSSFYWHARHSHRLLLGMAYVAPAHYFHIQSLFSFSGSNCVCFCFCWFEISFCSVSLSYVSVSLDETGLLASVSFWFATKAGSSGRRLFVVIFVLSSILTILTSNDVVVMTVTPIVLYTCQYVKVDPLPFLFAEFLSCNVWSSILYIGNPTNIIVAQANQVFFSRCFVLFDWINKVNCCS